MRGNPVKEWIIFSGLWLLLLIPVIKLTALRKDSSITKKPRSETAVVTETSSAIAILRYTEPPISMQITQNNRTLCDLSNLAPDETELELPLLIQGNNTEFLLRAEWSNANRHVLEIELFTGNKETRKQHYWAGEELHEAVSFSWPHKHDIE